MDRRTRNITGCVLAVLVAAYWVGERAIGPERGVAYMIGYGLADLLIYGLPVLLIVALAWYVFQRSLKTGNK